MIIFLRMLLDKIGVIIEKSSSMSKLLKPSYDAADSLFFGKPTVTDGYPHTRDYIDIKRYFITVVVTMIPCTMASIYFFGWRAVAIIVTSYVFGLGAEMVFAVVRKEEITEGAFVTCLIFPLILPPTIPLWMVALGIVFGIVFGKEIFGGTGKNIFNPAMVGRIFIAVTFPSTMITKWYEPIKGAVGGFASYTADAITSATPLITYYDTGEMAGYKELFFGNVAGSLGETSKLLIIMGGVFLMVTRVGNWRIPSAYLGTVALFAFIMDIISPGMFAPPLFQLLTGGLLFGAMFMATDPVSAAFTNVGKWIYGIMLGILTVLIRELTGYVEGVMFAIIFMNIFAPLIDQIVITVRSRKARR
ncbi:MAG: RnfABCDGE type electron transport complex subunit D [Candidatus Anammoxibacter sp.]